jgi:hypothetical protein
MRVSGPVTQTAARTAPSFAPARPKLGRKTPRWLVALGLVAYCAAVWAVVAAGAVAGVQFIIFALS